MMPRWLEYVLGFSWVITNTLGVIMGASWLTWQVHIHGLQGLWIVAVLLIDFVALCWAMSGIWLYLLQNWLGVYGES